MFRERADDTDIDTDTDTSTLPIRPLAGPFPNLRTREIVKGVVEGIVETITHTKMTANEQHLFALGYVRGAITTLQRQGDDLTLPFVLDMLARLNSGGVDAVRRLIEIVTGRDDVLERAAA